MAIYDHIRHRAFFLAPVRESVRTNPREGEYLIFLQATGVQGAKRFGPEGITSYASGAGPFTVVRFDPHSLVEAAAALVACPADAYLVRGTTSADTIPYRRHIAHGPSQPPSLGPCASFLLPIDFDSPPPLAHLDGTDLGTCAAACRELLPAAFHGARALAQATSSAGLKPGARVRLWFWCSEPVSDAHAKALLSGTPGVDLKIYSPSQPIYVCAPVFDPGLQDPFEGSSRWLMLPGHPAVELPPAAPTPARHAALPPPGDAIADGARNATLTSLAGAARRRGASAAAIEALLTQTNTEQCRPPLPEQEISAIARSVANYDPAAVTALAAPPKSSRRAKRALKDAAARVEADPALLEQVAPTLRQHVDSGAITSAEAATVLSRAMADAEVVRPITHAEIQATVANAPALAPEGGGRWAHVLRLDADSGAPRCDAENLGLFFEATLNVAWDVRRMQPHWIESAPWGATKQVGEANFELTRYLNRELNWRGMPVSPLDALVSIARKKEFDPFQLALNVLVWDGQERLLTAAHALLGARADDRASAMCFAWWLVSAVARTYQPGCKVDHTIVLVGLQDAGKSTFLELLAGDPRYFAELKSGNDPGDKDTLMLLQGAVIVEIAELAAIRRSDVESVKAFLTSRRDKFRAPYARTLEEHPRRCVFAATTNEETFLHDLSGARRFWPIQCAKTIARDLTSEWAPQLWAEAVHHYRAGAHWWPTATQATELGLAELQEARRETEGAEESLLNALERPRKPGVNHATGETWELWQLDEHGRVIAARREQLAAMCSLHPVKDSAVLTRSLRAIKWKSKVRWVEGQPQRVWQVSDYEKRVTWMSSQLVTHVANNSN